MSPLLRQLDTPASVFRVPPIPEKYDKTYKGTHYSEPDMAYQVNLFKLTCTCPDYDARKNRFPKEDLRLACKHILDKLKYTKLFQTYDSLTANLLYCSAYFDDDILVQCEISGTEYVLTTSQQSKWVNVHLVCPPKSGKGVVRFGFDVANWTWQYEQPKKSSQVEQYILSLL
jgi:hypothetical protein